MYFHYVEKVTTFYDRTYRKKRILYQKWTAAQSQSERWRVQRAPKAREGKNVKAAIRGVCVGRWESANRADVINMPPVNSPHLPGTHCSS